MGGRVLEVRSGGGSVFHIYLELSFPCFSGSKIGSVAALSNIFFFLQNILFLWESIQFLWRAEIFWWSSAALCLQGGSCTSASLCKIMPVRNEWKKSAEIKCRLSSCLFKPARRGRRCAELAWGPAAHEMVLENRGCAGSAPLRSAVGRTRGERRPAGSGHQTLKCALSHFNKTTSVSFSREKFDPCEGMQLLQNNSHLRVVKTEGTAFSWVQKEIRAPISKCYLLNSSFLCFKLFFPCTVFRWLQKLIVLASGHNKLDSDLDYNPELLFLMKESFSDTTRLTVRPTFVPVCLFHSHRKVTDMGHKTSCKWGIWSLKLQSCVAWKSFLGRTRATGQTNFFSSHTKDSWGQVICNKQIFPCWSTGSWHNSVPNTRPIFAITDHLLKLGQS